MNIRKRHNATIEFWFADRCVLRAHKSQHRAFYATVEAWKRLHSLVVTRLRSVAILAWKRLRDAARFLLPARCERGVSGELQRRIDAPYTDTPRAKHEALRVKNERGSIDMTPHPVELAFRAALGGVDDDPDPDMTRRCHERGVLSPWEIYRKSFSETFKNLGLKGVTS